MKETKLKIIDPIGLHARPASIAVAAANRYRSNVTIEFEDKSVDLKSIMSVMYLAVTNGSEVTVKTDGEDEQEAIDGIKETLKEYKIAE